MSMHAQSNYIAKIHCLTSEFHVKCHAKNRYPVLLSARSFLKFSKMLNFDSSFGKHLFSVNSFISKVFFFFPNTSCIFNFTIATIFVRNSRQQYRFMRMYNSTLNFLSSIATLPLPMRFLGELIDIEAAYLLID